MAEVPLGKRILWLVLLTALILIGLGTSKRIALTWRWRKGKVDIAQGCTVFSPKIFDDEDNFAKTADEINPVDRDGPIEMYETPIGTVWYPASAWTLPAVIEKNEADEYHLRSLVHPGDVVLDVGANVGTETRSALAAGASQVVAVEPDPLSLECLRRNVSSEIREMRVIVVPQGAWDREDVLPLHLDRANGGGASFVWQNSDQWVRVPVTTIDRMVRNLGLKRVDVIKVHAEGAEAKILNGAAETVRRYHPRLTIVLEHHLDDVRVLPAIARSIWPGYHLLLTGCTKTFNLVHPEAAVMTP